jgi:hypothetical protein
MEVLQVVRRPFCSFGYDRLLVNKLGDLPEFQGFCDQVAYGEEAAPNRLVGSDDDV